MNKKGITLIALVVTIIILLILAAISIAFLLGPDGIINKARESKIAGRYSEVSDLVDVRNNTLILNSKIGESTESADDFINKLKAQNLVLEDEYDSETMTITIGGNKKILISSDKDIIDAIANLPDADAPGNEHLKHMTLKVRTTTASENVEIPISDMTNLTIDWGDGTTTSEDTHIYSQANEYEVKIMGKSNDAEFGHPGYWNENLNLVGIKHWGENDFVKMNSFGTKLEGELPIPSRNSFHKVTEFRYTFDACSELTSIPENLFANCPNVTRFDGTFSDCQGLTSIPPRLFSNVLNVTEFEHTFYYCHGITSVPSELFSKNTNVTMFDTVFESCTGLTSIPEDLFANNIKATDLAATFSECTGLTSIPENLFANNVNVTDFRSIFSDCKGLVNIPPKLFSNNPEVLYFSSTFRGCIGITAIPSGLFDNNPNVLTFSALFSGCSNLTGAIPDGLFKNNTKVTNFSSAFKHCYGLTYVPFDLFDNCPNVSYFYDTFFGCYGLTSKVPELWKRDNVDNFRTCFYGCNSVANYSDIDINWRK